MQKPVVIFGKGQMAELAHFYFTNDSNFKIAAFCINEHYLDSSNYFNLPMVKFENIEETYPPSEYDMFIAVGYSGLNTLRKEKYLEAKAKGYKLVSYISTKTTYWGTEIGENCFVFENNAIMAFCKIGNNVTVWINSILAHHAVVGDHTTVTSHVAMGGNVSIGESCFFGLNSTIRNDVKIANNCIIAAGANVIKDTEPFGVYMGNPAALQKYSSDKVKLTN